MALFYPWLQTSHHAPASPEPPIRKQNQLELIWKHYARARTGKAGIVMVAGGPGTGKTYLLEHFAARAAQEGALVLRGHGSQADGMPAYLPFLEALGPYIRRAPSEDLYQQTALAPAILARLFPELALRLGELPAPYSLHPQQQRLRLYEAVGAFVEAISMTQPLLLLLDDFHLADDESCSLLCYLVRHHPRARLLILGAYREGDHQRNPALVRAITELTCQRALATCKVQPLSPGDVESLAHAYLGQPIDPMTALLLYAQSEGNPLFAEELLQGWIQSGAMTQEDGLWSLAISADGPLPSGIINMLAQQVAQLSPETGEHLRVAAIIGRTFDVSLLAAVEGQEIEVVEDGLLEAVRARLVQSDQAGRFRFSHRAIRDYLYDDVIASRRQRLHRLIAETLAASCDQEQQKHGRLLAELAYHFARGGDPAQGILYAQRAAAQTLQRYVACEIELLLGAPLQFIAGGKKRAGLFLPGTEKYLSMRGWKGEAQTLCERADTWLALAHELAAVARSAQELELGEWQQEIVLAAREALEHALTLLEHHPSPEGVQTLIDLAVVLAFQMKRWSDSYSCVQRLLTLARHLTDGLSTGIHPLVNTSTSQSATNIARLHALERILALIETSDPPEETTECWLYLVMAYYWMAEIGRSFDVALRWAAYSERSRQPDQMEAAYTRLGLLYASQGAWLDADQALDQALSVTACTGRLEPSDMLCSIRGLLAFQRGEYTLAGQAFQSLLTGPWNNADLGFFCVPLLSLILVNTRNQDEMARSLERLQELLTRLPAGTLPALPILLGLALLAVALGKRELAAELYHQLLAFQGQHCWFLVDRILGSAAAFAGDWPAAELHLTRAEAIARRENLLPELARTLLERADLELAKGKEDVVSLANTYLTEALALFEKLAMHEMAESIRRRLGLLPRRAEKQETPPLPAHLTRRELAVLRLVAEGKSNYQIAQKLSLSEKTVANHLTTIFYKTASENRAAATAFAIRHGLA